MVQRLIEFGSVSSGGVVMFERTQPNAAALRAQKSILCFMGVLHASVIMPSWLGMWIRGKPFVQRIQMGPAKCRVHWSLLEQSSSQPPASLSLTWPIK